MNAVDTQPNIAVDEYWRKLDLTLDVDPTHWLNTAHEACYRWTGQNRLAIVERHEDLTTDRWSFDQLADATSRFANALQTAGVSRGDRVCGLLPQGVEAHVSALAVWQIGAIFVPVYPGFGVGGIAQRIRGAEPKVVITDHESRTALDSALGESDADPRIIEVEQYRGRRSAVDGGFWGLIDAHDASAEIVRTAASDTATLLFSSGTTGDPKGCQLAHNYLLTMKPYARHSIALNPGELIASTSSPGWVNGLYSTAASVNAEGWSRAIYTGRFDPQKWRNFLIEEQIAFFGSAPSALRAMLPVFEAAGFPDTIKAATSAGEAQGYDLVRKWFEISGLHLGDTFGTTESGLFLATGRNDTHRVEFGALPPVVPGFEVALLNEDGTSNDEMGIISVRGRGMRGCTGYLGQEAKWSERWRDDWYLTGDLARRDEKGQLWYLGRDDDLIVTSGYNVAPAEVEPIIAQHENVQDVVVLDAPDAARGSVVRAVIVPNGELSADDKQRVADELKSLVKKQLGRHVYPRIIEFTDSIPRNHAGKALRNVLRQTPPQ